MPPQVSGKMGEASGTAEEEEERRHSSGGTEGSESEESSASDGEDSESSSDIDMDECETRREECLYVMTDIEKQFCGLKEQLYRERLDQIELQLGQVKGGRAPEYTGPLLKLQENLQIRQQVAGVLKELRLKALETKMEAETMAAKQNLESEKLILFDLLKDDYEEKIRKLEEDRHNLCASDLWQETKKNSRNKRSESGAGGEKRKKAVTVTGPYIVYLLRDSEIIEDWTIIKKSMMAQQQNNRNSSHKRSKSSEVHSLY